MIGLTQGPLISLASNPATAAQPSRFVRQLILDPGPQCVYAESLGQYHTAFLVGGSISVSSYVPSIVGSVYFLVVCP